MQPSLEKRSKVEFAETIESQDLTSRVFQNTMNPSKTNENLKLALKKVEEEASDKSKLPEEQEESFNFEVHGKKFRFAKTSLCVLSDKNRFRKKLVWIVESKWFDIGITTLIIINTIFLALTDYQYRDDPTKRSAMNDVVDTADTFFTVVFVLEFAMKVLAMGFLFSKGSYLRDGWNIIDFIVVVTSIANNIPDIPNFKALRSIRTMKPLKSITSIKGMKVLVNSLIVSLPALVNVAIFLSFLIMVYSILGVQLFAGAYENRCRLTPMPINGQWLADPTYLDLCGISQCAAGTYCGSPATYNIPKNWTEVEIPELSYGIPNFDNVVNATLTVFQSLTMEGWSSNMFLMAHTFSPAIVYIYFGSLIVFGSFFAVNLILAVVMEAFSSTHAKEHHDKMAVSLEKIHSNKSSSLGKTATPKRVTSEQHQKIPFHSIGTLSFSKFKEKAQAENQILSIEELGEKATDRNVPQSYISLDMESHRENPSTTDRPIYKSILNKLAQENKEKVEAFPNSIPHLLFIDEYLTERTQQSKIYYYAYKLVLSKVFRRVLVLVSLTNTVVLSLYQYPQDPDFNNVLETINDALTFIFLAEIIIKLLGLGFSEYIKDRFNLFEAILVILTLAEFITDEVRGKNVSVAVVTVFRTFRILRLIKLVRSWSGLKNLLRVLSKTLNDISSFNILLLLFIIIAALLGRELFAYQVRVDGHFPRLHFNDFLNAFITVFALLTTENWNNTMYDYVRSTGMLYAIYFVCVLLIGNYILLKLFLAILINNFEGFKISAPNPSNLAPIMSLLSGKKRRLGIQGSLLTKTQPKQGPRASQSLKIKMGAIAPSDTEIMPKKKKPSFRISASLYERMDSPDQSPQAKDIIKNSLVDTIKELPFDSPLSIQKLKEKDRLDSVLEGKSLFILGKQNKFRRLIARMILHPIFENFILCTIVLCSIALALDSPVNDPNASLSQAISVIDKMMTIIFMFEILCRIIVYGFIINGPYSYLRSFWGVLDSVIVAISLISFIYGVSDSDSNVQLLGQLKILRTLRVLRPLRLIEKYEGLKLVLNSIISALPPLINLICVCLMFFLLFGIVGVSFFKGQFYFCDMTNIPNEFHSAITTKQTCLDYGGDWINQDANFDNVLQAMLTLFQISTTQGWIDVMLSGIDTAGIDMQPIPDNRRPWAIFFIAFIIVGSFFILNLFAGIVVHTFNREKDRLGGISFLTKNQQAWVHMKLAMVNIKPERRSNLPKGKAPTDLRAIIEHRFFEIVIIALIILNMLIFALHWDRQNDQLALALDIINYILMAIFTGEAFIKIIGYRKAYFRDGWNLFDFTIIIVSILALIIDNVVTSEHISLGSAASVIRTFRVGRVLRLINKAKSLRTIFNTIIVTLPALANIGGLLLLTIFIFASLGNSLFAYTRLSNDLTPDINFQTFWHSFMTLFKISTGENWNSIMYACSRNVQPNYACAQINTYSDFEIHGFNDCGSRGLATAYFVTFIVLCTLILLNLFIAVILEAFEASNKTENSILTEKEYEHFKTVFKKFDPKGRGLIPEPDISFLLQDLKPPLGDEKWTYSAKERSKFIIESELPVYELPNSKWKYYQFHDILLCLSRRAVQRQHDIKELENLPENTPVLQLKEIDKTKTKHIEGVPNLTLYHLNSSYVRAASIITSWARFKRRREIIKKGDGFIHVARVANHKRKMTIIKKAKEEKSKSKIVPLPLPLSASESESEMPVMRIQKTHEIEIPRSPENLSLLQPQSPTSRDIEIIELDQKEDLTLTLGGIPSTDNLLDGMKFGSKKRMLRRVAPEKEETTLSLELRTSDSSVLTQKSRRDLRRQNNRNKK